MDNNNGEDVDVINGDSLPPEVWVSVMQCELQTQSSAPHIKLYAYTVYCPIVLLIDILLILLFHHLTYIIVIPL